MTRFPLAFFALATAVAAYADKDPQVGSASVDTGYTLVWQDLFDSPSLNLDRWNIEINGDGGGNSELQYYTDDNVDIVTDADGNSCLALTARRESYRGKSFTSGRINTKGRIAFTHGKVEAAIKMPVTYAGLWPAFWMLGNDYDSVGWPKCGETDIVEMGNADGISGGLSDRYFNGACHWGTGWPAASYTNHTTVSWSLQDGDFHLFTLIWDDDAIAMYVDRDKYPQSNPYYKMTIPADDPDNEWSPGNYFHKANFILFNLAVGGSFTGIYNASGITALNDDNGQEAQMLVNYVKVYQKGVAGEEQFFDDPGDGIENASLALVPFTLDPLPSIYYDLQGRAIDAPQRGNLYIVKIDSIASKIIY